MRESDLDEAKETLSTIVDKAIAGEPTVFLRQGRKVAVVISFQEYERLSRIPSLGQLLAGFPGDADDLSDRHAPPETAKLDRFT